MSIALVASAAGALMDVNARFDDVWFPRTIGCPKAGCDPASPLGPEAPWMEANMSSLAV